MSIEVISTILMAAGSIVFFVSVFKYVKHSSPFYWREKRRRFDFFMGLYVTLPIMFLLIGLQGLLFYHSSQMVLAVTAPLFEEPTKLLTIVVLVNITAFSRKMYHKRWVYYGMIAGFSFGFIEYVTYTITGFGSGVLTGLLTALVRIPPMLTHVVLGSLDALALLYWYDGKKLKAIGTFILSMSIHATINYLTFLPSNIETGTFYTGIFMGIVLTVYGIIIWRKHPHRVTYDDFMVTFTCYLPRNRVLKKFLSPVIGFYVPYNIYARVSLR